MNAEAISRPTEFVDATIASIIAKHVTTRARHPAIVMSKGEVITYDALWAQIDAFGISFRAHGLEGSARVAIMLPDGPELAVAIVATACHAGAVPLNPKQTVAELDDFLASSRIDALVTSTRMGTAGCDMAARHGILLFEASSDGPGKLTITSAADTSTIFDGEGEFERVRPDSAALILKTSATTGRPKLVPMTHRNVIATSQRLRFWFDLTEDDRSLCAIPLYYAHGLKGALLAPLLLGGSVALPDRKPDGDIIDCLVDLQPTWFDGGQAFLMDVLERARMRHGTPLRHRLRFIRTGGTPLSTELREGLQAVFDVPVLDGYSLTEGTVSGNAIKPELRKLGTVGRPLPNEAAIRAEDGHLLGTGEQGEIVVRGPALMPGYLDDEDANSAVFVEGWFRTGDFGSIDAEGFLTVLGRLKEFINRGGEKISPYEIEQALLLHPSVREAAAFAVPHPRLGENVAAAVVLMSGAETTPTEIKAFLADHLAPFKIPQYVLVKAEIPKGETGKTLRRQLSEEAAHRVREIAPPIMPLQLQILQVWQRLVGRDDIGIDDNFLEVGGDSLLATQMLCEVEAITRQQFPPAELRAVYTVRELAGAVLRGSLATAELVSCAKPGRGTPFIFCHGDYTGRGLYALKLADMLRGDRPVFLVHPDPFPDPQLAIKEMARASVAQILAAHPTGAFRLGGHCNGGLLAWEIARQLEHLGREVDFVALIDVPSLNARLVLRAIAQLIRFIVVVAPNEISKKFARDGMRAVWSYAKGTPLSGYGPYSSAISNYFPSKLTTSVICMISDESRAKREYSSTPWVDLAAEVRREYIPGTHSSCIREHVGEVAHLLNGLLSQPQATRLM
jgi:acyl-CoA synthetase (AMP-forming)/AMP-acid ligase II